MFDFPAIFRLLLALLLFAAQVSGGFARVVHCYDSQCRDSGIAWDCHFECGCEAATACHERCDHNEVDARSVLHSDGHHEVARPSGEVCDGQHHGDHHHHYVAAVELTWMHCQWEAEDSVGICLACLDFPIHRVTDFDQIRRRSQPGQNVAVSPAIPLIMRLRI